MKRAAIVIGAVALALALVAAGLWAGTAWAQGRWGSDAAGYGPVGRTMMGYGRAGTDDTAQPLACDGAWQGPGMMGGDWSDAPCGEAWQGTGKGSYGMMGSYSMGPGMMGYGCRGSGYGMMGSNWDRDEMPCGQAYGLSGETEVSSLEDVEVAVHDYVEGLGYEGLVVTELMEFERNYYAIVAEADTGIGAMELLIDKETGAVGPEPGPNMMWNAEYGMHGRGGGMMMGGFASGVMTVSAEEAEAAAQRWLDDNLPGREAGEADEFYGYYTLHFLSDGKIEGMLSVHGSSGDVWAHTWHGEFLSMTEGHD